jgi:flagellar biosynthetic protein FliP
MPDTSPEEAHMNTSDEARTPRAQTGSRHPAHAATGHGWRRLPRHYLEMVAAMLVGMVVLGAAVRGMVALAGLQYPTQYPELAALEMAFTMSAGMVVWMRHRGHRWASTLEIAGAMFAPAVALFPLLWLGVIAGDAMLVLEHLAMFPLMCLVMLRLRAEYGGAAHG